MSDRAPGGPAEPQGLAVPPDVLDLDPEEFRRLGYEVVDRTVAHLTGLPRQPVISVADADTLRDALGGPTPRGPGDLAEGLHLLADVALRHQQHGEHPRYFARVPGPSSPIGLLGDWLATGMQSIASSWAGGSGPATVELVALHWLGEALGLAPGSEGVVVSGGSMANTTALITARSEGHRGVLYLSDQTHASIRRGALAVGWDPALIRTLPTSSGGALDLEALRAATAADRAAGAPPGVVVATVGTTNTGAVDDLPAVTTVAETQGLWLHVDGAYGGPAALGRDRHGIAGLDLADSFVTDPHKWLFQPYDIGCLWVAHPGALERTFAMHPEYLTDAQGGMVDLHNRSLELSRRSRAAKLWLTLRTYGMDRIASAVDRGVALAEYAQAAIERDRTFEIVTPARLGIVTFRLPDADDATHARLAALLTADGYAALSSTVVEGRRVLRWCTINPRTTLPDLDGTLSRLRRFAAAW